MSDSSSSSSPSGETSTAAKEFESNLVMLRELCSGFRSKCEKCSSGEQVSTLANHPSEIYCDTCKVITCRVCGACGDMSKLTESSMATYCCKNSILCALWQVLCDFDKKILESRVSNPDSSETQETGAKKTRDSGVERRKIKAGNEGSGVGYGAGANDDILSSSTDAEADAAFANTLDKLNRLLISRSERVPRVDIGSLGAVIFHCSFLVDEIANLLRNDSITNITERYELYDKLFAFLQTLISLPSCHTLLVDQRPKVVVSAGLRAISIESSKVEISIDSSSSLISCFTKTYRQAKSFLELAEKYHPNSSERQDPVQETESRDLEYLDANVLCRQIVEVYGSVKPLQEALDIGQIKDLKNPWEAFCEENKVTFTDDVLKNHHFEKLFRKSEISSMGRMSIIGKEIASMTTSLPAGIFVKIAESRSDVMKVLIVGVRGSPYAGGLFPFDLFLEGEYPKTPPQVIFTLEDEGEKFNPNLHVGGSVCLSILNTFQGSASQMWQPGKSTILSVLVSIQAMILGAPIPWVNEPGHEGEEKLPEAIQDRNNIHEKVKKLVMIPWLQKIESAKKNSTPISDVWEETFTTYWKLKGEKVLAEVRDWVEITQSSSYVKRLEELIEMASSESTTATAPPNGEASGKDKDKDKAPTIPVSISQTESEPSKTITKEQTFKIQSAAHSTPLMARSTQGEKRKHMVSEDEEDDEEEKHWVYTGEHKQADVKRACQEFGVQPARGIEKSIERLEQEVNYDGKWPLELGEKWGEMQRRA